MCCIPAEYVSHVLFDVYLRDQLHPGQVPPPVPHDAQLQVPGIDGLVKITQEVAGRAAVHGKLLVNL